MNKNIKLYFYGLWANILSFSGSILIVLSLMIFVFNEWYFALFCLILGIGVLLYGNAVRLDYKRKSGYIIYNGK